MNVLVIGRSGQVARALRSGARDRAVQALGRPESDLEAPAALVETIEHIRPDVVVNAAAYTAVDQAEIEPDRAFAVNATGPEAVALAAARCGAVMIQISTDYVFDGAKRAPYVETDATMPTSVYGRSKLEGEQRVLGANPRAIVLRTSWVFATEGSNFVRTMLRLAKMRGQINVVSDQFGCPTFAEDLAKAILAVTDRVSDGGAFGIYHCAGCGETTWADLAAETFALSAARGGPSAAVAPILARDYPTRAARPANSRLDCSKLAADYGVRLRPWREALAACVDDIAARGWRVE
ncbi:dTDP-4-dehydrorhamnose reductase [Terricaulis silvestris]|uniref:dTDP-4-dehydrorhamnose reductase n=1 Tax=Terricaulis silvestris TaxID=2686094 RepID=A0A6I6MQW9_9CAUL|nr:dTDP-4-dehydrorhamnose reductase [Terricaulis silvestris]QGZ96561.1 dTDP-4-dehydrorhamnose reductase [Terricaulis silvestris]